MKFDVILAGVGGQGVLSVAAIIAQAAVSEGLNVRQSEVHGMAQRGGAVLAHLRLSDTVIAGDLVPKGGADIIISMEPLESLRYTTWLAPSGALVTAAEPFININNYPEPENVFTAIKSYPLWRLIEAAALAKEAGLARAVNTVMVGAASVFLPIKVQTLEDTIARVFSAKESAVLTANIKAFQLGRENASKGGECMTFQYREPQIEKMPRGALEALQLKKLKEEIGFALRTPFYKERLGKAGIKSPDDIKTLDDLRKIPFTTKNDLRDGFPYGFLSIPKEEVVRLHASSGTTGIPTTIYFNRDDIKRWSGYMARCIYGAGCTRNDVFQNMITYGLFTGGLGLHQGGEEVGMLVIPSGAGNTARQFRLMQDFGTTVVHATPSFLLHVETKMKEAGVKRESLSLKKAFAGAEPYSEDTRRRIEALLNIDVYNSYGLSEMNGPGVAFECQCKDGMHLWEDGYIAEIVNPKTLEPVKDGETGELVLTILCREATPLLRYRTRDLTSFYTEPCPCGRTHRRLRRITGRSDDMLIINGVNVFPSQIEEVIMGMKEVGNNYLIVVEKDGALDRLTIKTEVGPDIFMDDARPLNALKERIRETLQVSISISPRVELHEKGSLPISEGKAVRVQDKRPKDM